MQWIAQNWVWVLFFAAFIAMHLFGHGGHGRHGRGSGSDRADDEGAASAQGQPAARSKATGHQH